MEKMENIILGTGGISLLIAMIFFGVCISGIFTNNKVLADIGVIGGLISCVPFFIRIQDVWRHKKAMFYVFYTLSMSIIILSTVLFTGICLVLFGIDTLLGICGSIFAAIAYYVLVYYALVHYSSKIDYLKKLCTV